MKLPIATGPARGNQLAHGHTRPAQTERRGVRRPGRGFGPRLLGPARPKRRGHAPPAHRATWRRGMLACGHLSATARHGGVHKMRKGKAGTVRTEGGT